MTEARKAFEKWYGSTKTYQFIHEYIALHDPLIKSVFQKRGKNYINDAVQEAWNAWQEQQKMIDALKAENAELHSANVNMLNAKLNMQKSIDDAENYLHVALNSVDDETLCKSYLLSAVNALRGGSHD